MKKFLNFIKWFFCMDKEKKSDSGVILGCPVCGHNSIIEERYTWSICRHCKSLLEVVPGGFGDKFGNYITPYQIVEKDTTKAKEILGYDYIERYKLEEQ